MQRTKVYAVLAAIVTATATAIVLAGTASAAEWHVYEGDVFAGHAYGLDVPERSQSVEFVFDGAAAGVASLAVYAPDGARVGFYDLSEGLTTASVSNPDEGRYVVYVYDITDGALDIRVQSKDEPTKLQLEELDLTRQDVEIGTFEQGKLDQVITSDLKIQPVFVTLLYEGSASHLDATVSTTKGDVVVIKDETATAFQPGVWTSIKGERLFEAANLEGTTFTTEVHAASFQGTMVLTTLGLDLDAPMEEEFMLLPSPFAPPPSHPQKPAHAPAAAAPAPSTDAQFALEEGIPLAFTAPTGMLVLSDVCALGKEPAEKDDETSGEECRSSFSMVSLYAPDDSVLAVIELTYDEPTAEVKLPVAGEYVAYAHTVGGDGVVASIAGMSAAPTIRALALEEIEMEFDISSELLMGSSEQEFELVNVPLTMQLLYGEGVGLLSSIEIANEAGNVASTSSLVAAGGLMTPFDWTSISPANFAKGTHTLFASGTYEGDLTLVVAHYVRDVATPDAVVHAKHVEHEDHEAEEEAAEEEQEPTEPSSPVTSVTDLVYGLFP